MAVHRAHGHRHAPCHGGLAGGALQQTRVVATVDVAPPDPTIGDIQALLDARGLQHVPARTRDVVWSSRFHIHRVARDIVRMTDRMTWTATIENKVAQAVRNAAVQMIGHVPAVRQAIAMKLSELERAA